MQPRIADVAQCHTPPADRRRLGPSREHHYSTDAEVHGADSDAPDRWLSERSLYAVVLKSDNGALRDACTCERQNCNEEINALEKIIAEETTRYSAMISMRI